MNMFEKYDLVQPSPFALQTSEIKTIKTYLTFLNSLTFTMEYPSPDRFLPFLDVLIHPGPDKSTSVYRKPTHTNLYTNYSSSTTGSLTRRANNLCCPQHLDAELQTVRHVCLINKYYHGRSTPPTPPCLEKNILCRQAEIMCRLIFWPGQRSVACSPVNSHIQKILKFHRDEFFELSVSFCYKCVKFMAI